MQTTIDTNIHNIIKNRHSVRFFDPDFEISREEIENLLEEASQAPSSSNLQPWRVLVVTDDARKKLHSIAFNQQPVLDASATFVLLGDVEAYKQVEKIQDIAIENGLSTPEKKQIHIDKVMGVYPNLPEQMRREIAKIDGGLFAMQLMLIAKAKGYDTLPMGGYDAQKLVEEFNIPSQLVPVMLVAIGKAKQPPVETARLQPKDFVFWNEISE